MIDSYFTVYQSTSAIELHPGCPDNAGSRIICTCVQYEQASKIATILGNLHRLPVKNFTAYGKLQSLPNLTDVA